MNNQQRTINSPKTNCLLLLILTAYWLLPLPTAYGQPASPLDRVVSVEVRNERVSEILRQISQQGNFAFSYNPAVVNDTRTVTLRLVKQPVRIALKQLFEGQPVSWKTRGNYVLLHGEGEARKEPTHFYLDGYITDEQTGQKIAAASIYERTSLASTVSNPYGYYRLKLNRDLPTHARVEIRKKLYLGESVSVSSRQSRTVDVRLRAIPSPTNVGTTPVTQTVSSASTPIRPDTLRPVTQTDTNRVVQSRVAKADSLPTPKLDSVQTEPARADQANPVSRKPAWEQTVEAFDQLYQAARQFIHQQNLNTDTLYRPFQLSLLPYIGTNHKLSNHVINRLSINIVAGRALGVTGLEIGGFLNTIRGDVRGGQFAGFGNTVGRNVYGFQASGFFNTTRGRLFGGQFAGFSNTTRGDFAGIQAAGLFNYVGGNSGSTLQMAGWSNKTRGNTNRLIQLAGFSNRTRDLHNGLQAAGFINHAHTVRNSLQLAPFNVADSSNSIPVGLWSVVRQNGYRRFEIAANEAIPVNINFRSGVKRFYNMLSLGLNPSDREGQRIWQVGYGIGTGLGLGRTWMITLEGSGHLLSTSGLSDFFSPNNTSYWLRGVPLLEKRFGHMALAVGPSINFYYAHSNRNQLKNTRLLLQDKPLVSALPFTANGWADWIGWQVGLRWVR